MPSGWKTTIGVAVTAALLAALAAAPLAGALALLLDVSGRAPVLRALLPVHLEALRTGTLDIPTRHGLIVARLHRPIGSSRGTIVIIPGVHGAGIEEPRLNRFSARLAAAGLTVITAPLSDLREYRITGRSTDQIEDIVTWAASHAALTPTHAVSLVGVSFAGGLAVVAAGRPSLSHRLNAVVSLGGHGDMTRSLRYFSTGQLADGTYRRPHDYSLAVFALAAAEVVVPPNQRAAFERGVRTYLQAAVEEEGSRARAQALIDDVRAQAGRLDAPARTLLNLIADRDVAALGRALAPAIDTVAGDPALSPERSPIPSAPVYLLQGSADNVIPSTETGALARYLAAHGHTDVSALLSPSIAHVGATTSLSPRDIVALIGFWHEVLGRFETGAR